MYYNLFKAQIIGVIGSVETINGGTEGEFSKMSVACNGGYVNRQGEKVETTDWVEVILSKKATLANYVKGRKVLVEGIPKVNVYLNNKGEAVGKLQIVAPRVMFQDAKPGEVTQEDHQE